MNAENERNRERVAIYIDGFNLYFGLKDSGWRKYYWLNMQTFANSLVKSGGEAVSVKYFTARISGPPDKQKRQSDYLDALASLPNLQILFGKYVKSPQRCPLCRRRFMCPEEKMTDVKIAVELLSDAFRDVFDRAIVVSADADLVPPIQAVRTFFPFKKIVAAFPPKRHSDDLRRAASATFRIGESYFNRNQLPRNVTTLHGYIVRRPADWI